MDGKTLARIGAIICVAIAITAAVLEMRLDRRPSPPSERLGPPAQDTTTDPLQEQLLRCQRLGEAATRDQDCLEAWAESRRRFLGAEPERR